MVPKQDKSTPYTRNQVLQTLNARSKKITSAQVKRDQHAQGKNAKCSKEKKLALKTRNYAIILQPEKKELCGHLEGRLNSDA